MRILTGGSEASRLIARDAERPHQWARPATMARLLNTDQGPNCSLKQGNMQLWQLITTSYMAAASSQCFTRLLAISLSHNYCELRILITDHCFRLSPVWMMESRSSPAVPSQQQLGVTGASAGWTGRAGSCTTPHQCSALHSTGLDTTHCDCRLVAELC